MKSFKSFIASLIFGILGIEALLLFVKGMFHISIRYRGYKAIGGEWLVLPLIYMARYLVINVNKMYKKTF